VKRVGEGAVGGGGLLELGLGVLYHIRWCLVSLVRFLGLSAHGFGWFESFLSFPTNFFYLLIGD
jgi:hypothetical protein